MRNAYIVAYDISDPKRLQRVAKKMRGFGDRVQYSVFRCELSKAEVIVMKEHLLPLMNQREDQILIIPLGPPGGVNDGRIESLGRAYVEDDRKAVVV